MFVILCRTRDGVVIFHDVIVYFISLSAENEFISINYMDVSVGKLHHWTCSLGYIITIIKKVADSGNHLCKKFKTERKP